MVRLFFSLIGLGLVTWSSLTFGRAVVQRAEKNKQTEKRD